MWMMSKQGKVCTNEESGERWKGMKRMDGWMNCFMIVDQRHELEGGL